MRMIQDVTNLDSSLVRFVAFFVRFTGQIALSTSRSGQFRCKPCISGTKARRLSYAGISSKSWTDCRPDPLA